MMMVVLMMMVMMMRRQELLDLLQPPLQPLLQLHRHPSRPPRTRHRLCTRHVAHLPRPLHAVTVDRLGPASVHDDDDGCGCAGLRLPTRKNSPDFRPPFTPPFI